MPGQSVEASCLTPGLSLGLASQVQHNDRPRHGSDGSTADRSAHNDSAQPSTEPSGVPARCGDEDDDDDMPILSFLPAAGRFSGPADSENDEAINNQQREPQRATDETDDDDMPIIAFRPPHPAGPPRLASEDVPESTASHGSGTDPWDSMNVPHRDPTGERPTEWDLKVRFFPQQIPPSWLELEKSCGCCLMDFGVSSEESDGEPGTAVSEAVLLASGAAESQLGNSEILEGTPRPFVISLTSSPTTSDMSSATQQGSGQSQREPILLERQSLAEPLRWPISLDGCELSAGAPSAGPSEGADLQTESGAPQSDGSADVFEEGGAPALLDDAENIDDRHGRGVVTAEAPSAESVDSDCEPISPQAACANAPDDWIGLISCCRHAFHFECIVLWGARENTCPQCKFRFPAIGVYDRTGSRVAYRTVEKIDQKEQHGGSGDDAVATKHQELRNDCFVCYLKGPSADEACKLVPCSGSRGRCDESVHWKCLGLTDSEAQHEFYCPTCIRRDRCTDGKGARVLDAKLLVKKFGLPEIAAEPIETLALKAEAFEPFRALYCNLQQGEGWEKAHRSARRRNAAREPLEFPDELLATAQRLRAARRRRRDPALSSSHPRLPSTRRPRTASSRTTSTRNRSSRRREDAALTAAIEAVSRERTPAPPVTGEAPREEVGQPPRTSVRRSRRGPRGPDTEEFRISRELGVDELDVPGTVPIRGAPSDFAEYERYEREVLGNHGFGMSHLASRRSDGGAASGSEFLAGLLLHRSSSASRASRNRSAVDTGETGRQGLERPAGGPSQPFSISLMSSSVRSLPTPSASSGSIPPSSSTSAVPPRLREPRRRSSLEDGEIQAAAPKRQRLVTDGVPGPRPSDAAPLESSLRRPSEGQSASSSTCPNGYRISRQRPEESEPRSAESSKRRRQDPAIPDGHPGAVPAVAVPTPPSCSPSWPSVDGGEARSNGSRAHSHRHGSRRPSDRAAQPTAILLKCVKDKLTRMGLATDRSKFKWVCRMSCQTLMERHRIAVGTMPPTEERLYWNNRTNEIDSVIQSKVREFVSQPVLASGLEI